MQKYTTKSRFEEIYCKPDRYFGEWYLLMDNTLSEFILSLKDDISFHKQITSIHLYSESLNILKIQAEETEFSLRKLFSREIWFCNMCVLYIGIIDQHTKSELKHDGKLKTQQDRFLLVMNKLSQTEKNELLNNYHGGKFDNFNSIVNDIYKARNFYSHEAHIPIGLIPQDGHLAFSMETPGFMKLNMPHGQIFLYVIIAILRYLGFQGVIKIKSDKEFTSIIHALRKT